MPRSTLLLAIAGSVSVFFFSFYFHSIKFHAYVCVQRKKEKTFQNAICSHQKYRKGEQNNIDDVDYYPIIHIVLQAWHE